MKRVWFAVAFIFLCIGLCMFEQIYVSNSCTELVSMIEQAQKYEKEKDKSNLNKEIKRIQDYWKRKNDILFIFSEHQTLDELALNIRTLKEAHNMKSALAETKTLVIIYYENEKIALSNVF